LQSTGLRAAKQALALFNFHHQQPQQQREILMVQWPSVDACDVPAGEYCQDVSCADAAAAAALPTSPHASGIAILCHLAYFSLLCGNTVAIRRAPNALSSLYSLSSL
jgi:hypothetical protein